MTGILIFAVALMVTGAACFGVGWAVGFGARQRDELWRKTFERFLDRTPPGEQPTRELPIPQRAGSIHRPV